MTSLKVTLVKQVATKTKTEIKLDEKDKQILRELQEDCKQTFKQIAKKLKLPETTVKRRVKRLENEKVIRGYHAVLDPKKIGKTVAAFFYIEGPRVEGSNSPKFEVESIGVKLAKIPHIQEAYSVVGERDYMLKGYYNDVDEYFELSKEIAKYAKSGGGILVSKVYKETLKLNII